MSPILALTADLVAIDSRSSVCNRPILERLAAELPEYELESIDYVDADGIEKRNLVAHRGRGRGIAFAGHVDTVPASGWTRDPFRPDVEDDILFGLGASDMKGGIAAAILALRELPPDAPGMLLLTADEETNKRGVREMVARSRLLRELPPRAIVVGEPSCLRPIRGHRVDVQFTIHAEGVQAHSSTPDGRNANIALIPFLADMRELHLRLRTDPALQDPAYVPPWCDLNIIVDNHGTAANTTVGRATCRMKLRYSKAIDPEPIVRTVRASAERHGLALDVRPEASPPELAPDHPLVGLAERVTGARADVAAFGTEASEYKKIAAPLILGPGDIAQAHKPSERVRVADLEASVGLFREIALEVDRDSDS